MRPIVVLSNRWQRDYFLKAYDPSTFIVLTDNPAFVNGLESDNISVHLLTEFALSACWAEVNAWACSKAVTWPELCKKAGLFREFNYPAVVFYYFSHLLVQILKNYLYAEYILEKFQPDKMVLFNRSSSDDDFPRFDGNYFLNFFLREHCEQSKVPFELCEVSGKNEWQYSAQDPFRFKKRIKTFFKSFLVGIFQYFNHYDLDATIVAMGTLRHLASVLPKLSRCGERVVYFDESFYFDKYLFALRHGISYRVAKDLSAAGFPQNRSYQYFLQESSKALERFPQHFIFRGHDFGDFIYHHVFMKMEKYFVRISQESCCYRELLQKNRLKGLVVEEDFAAKGSFLSEFMKHQGVRTFCISHANVAMDFSVPPSDRHYAKSVTFVNSEFEKATYQDRGWNGESIRVTGTPRYDRLLQLFQRGRAPQLKTKRMKLLVCGGSWWPQSPDDLGYLGLHVEAHRELQEVAMKELFLVARHFPEIEIVVKPHHLESEPQWKRFVKAQNNPNKIRLMRYSDDIFKLLVSCDAMVLAHWSTTLIEAAMVKLPIIFLNIRPTISAALQNFAQKGFCRIACNRDDIFNSLSALAQVKPIFPCDENLRKHYLGECDGHAAARVAEEILSGIEQSRQCPCDGMVVLK